jgi:hypothetical protein
MSELHEQPKPGPPDRGPGGTGPHADPAKDLRTSDRAGAATHTSTNTGPAPAPQVEDPRIVMLANENAVLKKRIDESGRPRLTA